MDLSVWGIKTASVQPRPGKSWIRVTASSGQCQEGTVLLAHCVKGDGH